MPNRVQFADAIEPLVQFIEETPPSEIVDRTRERLRAGVPARTMLTASAMAVARSSDLPPGHHGGPPPPPCWGGRAPRVSAAGPPRRPAASPRWPVCGVEAGWPPGGRAEFRPG